MLSWYLEFSAQHGYFAAFVQFGVLGLAGEVAAIWLRRDDGAGFPFGLPETGLKALGWGALGIYIKCMFVVASIGSEALMERGLLPPSLFLGGFLGQLQRAFIMSAVLNLMLGPSMMILHRQIDRWVARALHGPDPGWAGIDRSLRTLIWLWIPLHTFTFVQVPLMRVGIAALLSLVLGVVMGLGLGRRRA